MNLVTEIEVQCDLSGNSSAQVFYQMSLNWNLFFLWLDGCYGFKGGFSPSFHQYGQQIYFTLCVIIQYNCLIFLVLKLFRFWPLGALLVGSSVPLIESSNLMNLFVSEYFLTS